MTTLQLVTLTTAIIGAACGVLGAALGIINMWHRLSKDAVRLKVLPAHALPVGHGGAGEWTLSIEVINLSAFPVTIGEVGLRLWGTKDRLTALRPIVSDGGPWPRRLESREAVTLIYDSEIRVHERLHEVRSAYAKTQCGTTRYGHSGALKQLVREAQERHGVA